MKNTEPLCAVCTAVANNVAAEAAFVAGYICGRFEERTGATLCLCAVHAGPMRAAADGMVAIPLSGNRAS